MILALVLGAAGCASTPAEQASAGPCKVSVADSVGRPSRNVSAAEQAAAEMRVSRLAVARGGYATGSSLLADLGRDCH
jgi:hypothetical protein